MIFNNRRERGDTHISGFLLINAASLRVNLARGSDEAGGIRNCVIMPQAVKGNEGRYSGLLLHDHPKTHPRINEGAGGRLISLYCGAAGTGGVGQSGLKPAVNPLEMWQLGEPQYPQVRRLGRTSHLPSL